MDYTTVFGVPNQDSPVLTRGGKQRSTRMDGHRQRTLLMNPRIFPADNPGRSLESEDASRGITNDK